MTVTGPYGLFMITACAHVLITAYAIFRSRMRAATAGVRTRCLLDDPTPGTLTTPESLQLSRSETSKKDVQR